jgi:hypothetical protein
MLGALGAGATVGVDQLRGYLADRERAAVAAELEQPGTRVAAAALPATHLRDEPTPTPDLAPKLAPDLTPDPAAPAPAPAAMATTVAPASGDGEVAAPPPPTPKLDGAIAEFCGRSDEELMAPLRTAGVVGVRVNHGGSSLSLRLDLEGGGRASFKPEQINPQSIPRKEVAAYRLDRWLGIGRVSPAMPRRFRLETLLAAVGPRGNAAKIRTEAIAHGGWVTGELQWWIPVIDDARIATYRIDEVGGIVTWRKELKAGAVIPEEHRSLLMQISDMVLFDYVIDNTDRWSGSNAKISEDRRFLYFMDNTLSFSRSPKGHTKSQTYIERVQVFSRRLVTRLRALTHADLEAMMVGSPDAFPQLLTSKEIDAVLGRRDRALAYVDGLIAEHGEDAVLVFP